MTLVLLLSGMGPGVPVDGPTRAEMSSTGRTTALPPTDGVTTAALASTGRTTAVVE